MDNGNKCLLLEFKEEADNIDHVALIFELIVAKLTKEHTRMLKVNAELREHVTNLTKDLNEERRRNSVLENLLSQASNLDQGEVMADIILPPIAVPEFVGEVNTFATIPIPTTRNECRRLMEGTKSFAESLVIPNIETIPGNFGKNTYALCLPSNFLHLSISNGLE